MTDTATLERPAAAPQKTEHFDVLIVGAGISGVGGAYHLAKQSPETSFVVLEGLARPTRLEGPDPSLLAAAYAEVSADRPGALSL